MATGSAARRSVVAIFLTFAFAYFFSALLRAVTATLAPVFSVELGLGSADLGLLAGAYFLGFAALQLPLGAALDRWGPKRVLLALLGLAVVGCLAFAQAASLRGLFAARALIGMGVAACLMAPLTCYRLLLTPAAQLRANSWMLMTGSLGMLASTLPVQWLLPVFGWRGLFVLLAALLLLAMALIVVVVPRDRASAHASGHGGSAGGYLEILRHPVFVRSAPVGFFTYGGMVAIQSLWAGPWLTRVAGQSAEQAAEGLFLVNSCMLLAFMGWGTVMPHLVRRGLDADRLMRIGLPFNLLILAGIVWSATPAGAWAWAAWCVSCSVVSLSQPAVGQAFPAQLAGRALSAFNLVMFAGIFVIQWGVGLVLDLAVGAGWTLGASFRLALAILAAMGLLSYVWYVSSPVAPRCAAGFNNHTS